MLDEYKIANTTKEQREEIVKNALSVCGGACDGCSGCTGLGGGDPWEMYQPYIDGVKEIDDINKEYLIRYTKG